MSIDETTWEGEDEPGKEVECLCLGCGYTHFVPADILIMDTAEEGSKLAANPICSECGQVLMVV